MSDLDRKLHRIANDLCSLSVDEGYAIVAIKQAFKDEGWVDTGITPEVKHITGLMTGQGFYDKFEKEYTSQPIVLTAGYSETPEDWITRIDMRIKEAAKKAAGIEE